MSVLNHGLIGFMGNSSAHNTIHLSSMILIVGSIDTLRYPFRTGSGDGFMTIDDHWYLFPGYKLVLYNQENRYLTLNDSWSGQTLTLDNSNGTNVKLFRLKSNAGNKTKSFKAYYGSSTTPLPKMYVDEGEPRTNATPTDDDGENEVDTDYVETITTDWTA